MTQRERLASSGGTEAVLRHGSQESPRPPAPSLWEQVFSHASPERQAELLALAREQGVLYAHQLPAASNGHGHTNGSNGDHANARLTQILTGNVAGLEPLRADAVNVFDQELDENQRQAVARAVHTPDFCLIQGLPGTGKSRVVAEIILQAAQRGERILLLAQHAAALDRILELVGGHDLLCPIRCTSADESLGTNARNFIFSERLRELREPALARAREELAAAEAAQARHARIQDLFARLGELAEQVRTLETDRAALATRQAGVAAEIEAEVQAMDDTSAHGDGIAPRLAHARAVYRESTAGLEIRRTELASLEKDLNARRAALVPRLDALRPVIENRRRGRWWTADWWRLLLSAKPAQEFDRLDAEDQKVQAELIGCSAEMQRLEKDQVHSEQAYQALRDQVVNEEVVRRRSTLAGEEAVLRRDRERLGERWQAMCLELQQDEIPVPELNPETLATVRQEWESQSRSVECRQYAAREWLDYLEQQGDTLASRLTSLANLVAGTTSGLASDEHFGNRSGVHFDLLILQDAELATRSDLLSAAHRARRWVLVGEPDAGHESDALLRSPTALQPSLFASLWHTLAADARRCACTWIKENERLCCRLRPVTPEQRAALECERLADRPDIELRILNLPRSRPVVAEILFPRAMSAVQAKEFIFQELEELSIHPAGALAGWCTSEPIALVFTRGTPTCSGIVRLGDHVREILTNSGPANANGQPLPVTTRLEFDGWSRAQAEEWVQQHLGIRDLGRVAHLDVPHRMSAEMAEHLSQVLFAGGYQVDHEKNGVGSVRAIEFISADRRPGTEGNGNGRKGQTRSPRAEGAGLELDLADRRHLDRLPAELRSVLPAQGLVNYFEAQAIVRALESLAASDPAALGSTAVIALYATQAELIRQLVAQSAALQGANIPVDTPDAFAERESDIVLVSLTRSHTHRAVSFGDGPRALATALTRARRRLLVFGDPGTLARRCQWETAVDHLDGAAAGQERAIISRLVRFIDSVHAAPRTVAPRAGAGV